MKNKFIKASFLLACISFSSVLLASNLDIKGIFLGDSYDSIRGILPCADFNEFRVSGDDVISYHYTYCKMSNQRGNAFEISYSFDKKVYSVTRSIEFTIFPDAGEVQQKLISKYGQPSKKLGRGAGAIWTMCWGDCKDSEDWRGVIPGDNDEILEVRFFDNRSDGYPSVLQMRLLSIPLKERNFQEVDKNRKNHNKLIKKREFNFDL